MTDNLSYLIPEQIAVLLAPIKEHRVGKDGKNFSHVEAYELRAHLNRIFGFARWSEEVVEQDCIFEEEGQVAGKKKWTTCYRSLVRLTVCAPDGTTLAVYTEGATGDATNQPSRADAHDLALKTSASQAFKRCCMNLGDSFGLSLYRKGSLAPLVKVTLVNGQGGAAGEHAGTDVQDAAPPTFREPEPQPETATPERERGGMVSGESPEQPSSFPADETDAALAPTRTPEDYVQLLRDATTKKECIALLQQLSMDGHADATVPDEHLNMVTLTSLATSKMKSVA